MTTDQIGMLLFDLAVILLIARLVGAAARRLGQPAVILLPVPGDHARRGPPAAVGVVAQWLGLNYIFGAFLFGVIVPTAGAVQLRRDVRERLGGLCQLLLLPVFFVVTGLQVNLRHAGLAGSSIPAD